MNAIQTEMLYFRRRMREALAMADAAAGPCSRTAHETLARLYGEALAALSASLRVTQPVAFAPREIRVAARPFRPAARGPCMTATHAH